MAQTWTENVTLRASATLGAGLNDSNSIDLAALAAQKAVVQTTVTFGATPDGDVLIEVLSSSDGGANYDTIAMAPLRVTFEASVAKRVTIDVELLADVSIKVTNEDTTDNVTIEQKYAWLGFA